MFVCMASCVQMQGAPYQALSVPQSMWPGVGLTDVLLAAKGPYSAMAAAQDGHVSDGHILLSCWAAVMCQHKQ